MTSIKKKENNNLYGTFTFCGTESEKKKHSQIIKQTDMKELHVQNPGPTSPSVSCQFQLYLLEGGGAA